MQDIQEWKSAISMMLGELFEKSQQGDAEAASEICDTIEGQLEKVIALAPDEIDTH